MACESCMERRRKLKEYVEAKLARIALMARLRKGADAEPSASASPLPEQGTEAPAEGAGQAGEASAQHEQRGVEADTPAGDRPRRQSVSRVRKGRERKGSAR